MIKKTLPYLLSYTVIFMVMISLLVIYPKGELHIMLNSVHTPMADVFFKYFTQLANWPLYVIALTPVFFHHKEWVKFYLICEITAALVITTVKHIFRMPRPLAFFDGKIESYLPVVDGVHLHNSLSFPSGHTSTFFIFATVTVLLFTLHKKSIQTHSSSYLAFSLIQLFMVLFATLGGYSRIYLSQHFLLDVCVGSFIGVTIPYIFYYFLGKRIMVSQKD